MIFNTGQPRYLPTDRVVPPHETCDLKNEPMLFQSDVEFSYRTVKMFSTYHPAFLVDNESAAMAVQAHLQLLVDHLDGKPPASPTMDFNQQVAAPPVLLGSQYLSLDIETLGILRGHTQTNFHPVKMVHHDGMTKDNMVVTVALGYRATDGSLCSTVFVMEDSEHRAKLAGWLSVNPNVILLGQNILFDLMCLRYCYPELRKTLDHPRPIWDLIITNYLHNEMRPERSLKNLAPLLGVTRYDGEFRQYDSPWDPQLWAYNCKDTVATLLCQEKLEQAIPRLYGERSKKLGPFCRRWYSDLLWLTLWMSETGVRVDPTRLQELLTRYQGRLGRLKTWAKEKWDIPICGKGSEKDRRAIVDAARDLVPSTVNLELALTPKTKKPKFDAENRNALLNVIPRSSVPAQQLRLLGRYQEYDKLLGTYLRPMLEGRGKDQTDQRSRIIGDRVYPLWFPVPSQWEDGTGGGTKQSRFSAKQPGVQTFPKGPIKDCIRMDIWVDYAQIELRVAALLSGDPAMCQEYRGKPDLHGRTAQLMFGPEIANHPNYKSHYRQAGKTFNFRALFRGGAQKAHDTLLGDLGIDLSLARIHEIDTAFWNRHARLWQWQEELLDMVRKTGYYELPLIGQSRFYLGAYKNPDYLTETNEIVNQPVQTFASNIMQSAQFTLWRRMREMGLRSTVPMNWHDAGGLEIYLGERDTVHILIGEVFPNPPFYQELCEGLGRSLPLEYELT